MMHSCSTNETEAEQQERLSNAYVAYLQHLSSSWSSYSAARILKSDLLAYICPRFHRCSTPIKVRILTSLLYISPQVREECRVLLSELLNDCETEGDDWVRKLSRLLQPYVATGHIDIREIDTEMAYRTIKYMDEQRRVSGKQYRVKPPLEYSRVFDVTEDVWPPLENPEINANDSIYPSSISKCLASLPPYQSETNHFTAGGDFSLFMQEVETQGLAIISREARNLEHQQSRRRQI